MIKNEFIKIKVSSGLKQNYSGLGYDFSQKEVDFKISDLKEVSNQRIDVICDLCSEEYNIQYCKYIKNIKRNSFYSCKECGLKKRTEMMINNNISLNKIWQEKKKNTFIKNYGVDNPSKAEKIKIKKKETCLKNYGVKSGLLLKHKVKEGMLNKYGVEYPLQSDFIKNKMYEDLIIKYGVNNISKLIEIKEKKNKKIIETNLEKYGVKCVLSLDKIKDKIKETNLKKYGVSHPMQDPTIFKKQLLASYKIVYYNDELFSQGSYELDFLNYCQENNTIDLISNGPSLVYELNGQKHVYHADFYIEKYNLIVEIKSNYTYNVDLEKNLAKEKYSKLNGYNFLFIIDKNYDILKKII